MLPFSSACTSRWVGFDHLSTNIRSDCAQPWTANAASKQESEEEKKQKLAFMTMLRTDLEQVRLLAELARKREKEKLRQAQLIKDFVDSFLFPYYGQLVVAFERIAS